MLVNWSISTYMHQALPPPLPPNPHGMGPIYWPHMRSSPSPPLWCGGGVALSPSPPHGLGPQVAAPIPFYLQAIGSISEVQLRIC